MVLFLIILILCVIVLPIIFLVRSIKKMNEEYELHRRNTQDAPEAAHPGYSQNVPSLGIAILGFLFPLIGLIMYIVWLNSLPFRARSAGKGALASVITGVVGCAAFVIFGILFLR